MNFTIFTTPKPLEGRRLGSFLNALGTWQRLIPMPEIIVFGKDEILDYLNVKVVREYECSEDGLPFIDNLFAQAQEIASNDILVYTNDDILFSPDLAFAVKMVSSQAGGAFLATGQRWDTDINTLLLFEDSWHDLLLKIVKETGVLHSPSGKDYFIFNRPLGLSMRHVYVGRPAWDVILVADALRNGLIVVDLTQVVTAIHANHDLSHNPGGVHPNETRLADWRHNISVSHSAVKDLPGTLPSRFPWVLQPDGHMEERNVHNNHDAETIECTEE